MQILDPYFQIQRLAFIRSGLFFADIIILHIVGLYFRSPVLHIRRRAQSSAPPLPDSWQAMKIIVGGRTIHVYRMSLCPSGKANRVFASVCDCTPTVCNCALNYSEPESVFLDWDLSGKALILSFLIESDWQVLLGDQEDMVDSGNLNVPMEEFPTIGDSCATKPYKKAGRQKVAGQKVSGQKPNNDDTEDGYDKEVEMELEKNIDELLNSNEEGPKLLGDDKKTKDVAPKEKPKAWTNGDTSKLFKKNRETSKDVRLKFTKIESDVVEIPSEGISHEWDFTLIGYFTGRFPGLKTVHGICKRWGVKYSLSNHDSGWLMFKLGCEEEMERVLNGGPYSVWGRTLMLKKMPLGFRFNDFEILVMPVWAKLNHLPMCCWNNVALSLICSKIGRPIQTDRMTFTKERVSYVRVLIEVDAAAHLVREVSVKVAGEEWIQPVEYEFEPQYCMACGNSDMVFKIVLLTILFLQRRRRGEKKGQAILKKM
ncbi:hypothetical protein ACS0TY_018937 [Phlomoides rotata]